MSVIENGLRADIMRKRMEDKNTLQNKGSLYVGTGNKETIENKDIYETAELLKGNNGNILVYDKVEDVLTLHWSNFLNTTVYFVNTTLRTKTSSFSSTTSTTVFSDLIEQSSAIGKISLSKINTSEYICNCKIQTFNNSAVQKEQIICFNMKTKQISEREGYEILLNIDSTREELSTVIVWYSVDADYINFDFSDIFNKEPNAKIKVEIQPIK